MPSAFEHGLHIGEALLSVDKTGGFAFRIQLGIAEQRIGQLAETGFQGDLALGAALLLVGQVEVFEAGLGVGEVDLALELGVSLPCSSMLARIETRRSSSSRK